jgi:hypothetical protein
MKRIFQLIQLCFVAALFFAALPSPAEAAPKQVENRFLFIVDTSHAMRGYSNAVVQNITDLLSSDMKGEFRQGDTIGLWLYNDKLDPQYPMQVWSKADKDTIVTEMAAFLRGRHYEKQARLERVMPALNQVIKNSERITIVLIYDGTGSIQGTPFDKDIRTLQKKYAPQLRAAHVPFVAVLVARSGSVFDYTINYPGSVAIPHTASPEKIVETNAPVATIAIPPATVTNAPPKPHESIILSHATYVAQIQGGAPPPAPVAVPVAPHPDVLIVPAPPPAAPVAPAPVSQPAVAVPPPANQPALAANAPPQAQPITPPASVPANDQPPPAAPSPAPNTPVAVAGPTGGVPLLLFGAAFLLLTVAVVLLVILVRRSRQAPESSLISQSIDRPR